MESEYLMHLSDVERKSFNKGWKASIKKTCEFFDSISCCGLVEDIEVKELVKKYKKFMEEQL